MMFGLGSGWMRRLAPAVFGIVALLCPAAASASNGTTAVVPTAVIYPGQSIDPSQLREVPVDNPNIRADYIHTIDEIDGMVATRTLLPGRVIPPTSVRVAYAVERGKPVRLVYSSQGLTITASGMPLQNAAVGDPIRVRNIETGVTVSGTVADDGSVQVAAR